MCAYNWAQLDTQVDLIIYVSFPYLPHDHTYITLGQEEKVEIKK